MSRPLSRSAAVAVVAALLIGYAASQQVLTFRYIGCFVDTPTRDLPALVGRSAIGPFTVTSTTSGSVNSNGMTIEFCSNVCQYGRYPYFALQYYNACNCGVKYGTYGLALESNCNTPCLGNASQNCGGAYFNSVYEIIYSDSVWSRQVPSQFAPVPPNTSIQSMSQLRQSRGLVECLDWCLSNITCHAMQFSVMDNSCLLMQFAASLIRNLTEMRIRQ